MPPQDPRAEIQNPTPESTGEMKKVERFLRLLTWQMFFVIVILAYLAMRPQAGRYQFTVVGEDVGVFDTSNSQAWMIKLQKKSVTPGEKLQPGASPPEGESKK